MNRLVRFHFLLESNIFGDILSMPRRVLRDDPSKSDMHNRQGLSIKMIFWALCDWQLWPLYLIGLTFGSR